MGALQHFMLCSLLEPQHLQRTSVNQFRKHSEPHPHGPTSAALTGTRTSSFLRRWISRAKVLILRAFIIPLTDRIKTNRFLEVQKGEKKLVAECRKRAAASPLESPPSRGEEKRGASRHCTNGIASDSERQPKTCTSRGRLFSIGVWFARTRKRGSKNCHLLAFLN